jgi:hypothetical protein
MSDGQEDAPAPQGPAIDRRMLEALVCPMTHGTLSYDAERQELISKAAHWPTRSATASRSCWKKRRGSSTEAGPGCAWRGLLCVFRER